MRKWSSKVLLFGEYTVIDGGQALALPYKDFFGYWEKDSNDVNHNNLSNFLAYLKKKSRTESWITAESLSQFSLALENHLAFKSNIPLGYGLGSSGALVAGWYATYIGNQEVEIRKLQKQLSVLESHFHGSSSGFDPLIALLNKMILIHNRIPKILPTNALSLPQQISLLDTHISRSTAPWVNIYKRKKEDRNFKHGVIPALMELNRLAIEAYLLSDWRNLHDIVYQISELQWIHFEEMIPESIHPIWKSGLDRGEKILKLCGAGGGGMMLQFEQ